MHPLTRRTFITTLLPATALAAASRGVLPLRGAEAATVPMDRIRGLVLGSALGDALGGPIEFQAQTAVQGLADPPKLWRPGEKLDRPALAATAARLRLRPYSPLRPATESYGQWNPNSAAGTITDDTRHKLVLFHMLHRAEQEGRWPVTVRDLAKSYLDWPGSSAVVGRDGYPELARDWLEEWQLAARWILGERDPARALPPERMWQSLPTCCGQMTLLPLAALFPGDPVRAYQACYNLAFFDNGFGKDLNAALVAGLAQALVTPVNPRNPRAAFESVLQTMRSTDPLRFSQIRWSQRAVHRWLDLALKLARQAAGEPAALFNALEQEFAHTTKWEAQVPFVVAFACLELADYHPLAALQLSMEWGHDTDSYAQLVGAFAGAMLGAGLFEPRWIEALVTRLKADHGTDLEAECRFLAGLPSRAKTGGPGLISGL